MVLAHLLAVWITAFALLLPALTISDVNSITISGLTSVIYNGSPEMISNNASRSAYVVSDALVLLVVFQMR